MSPPSPPLCRRTWPTRRILFETGLDRLLVGATTRRFVGSVAEPNHCAGDITSPMIDLEKIEVMSSGSIASVVRRHSTRETSFTRFQTNMDMGRTFTSDIHPWIFHSERTRDLALSNTDDRKGALKLLIIRK
jgi:hypothetical protein